MGSKQIHVKNWHLRKMDWEQKNGKQTASKKRTGILKKMDWDGKMGSKQF